MTEIVQQQPVEAANAAFARHAWGEAYERFAEADKAARLMPADLESYAEAAWWSGNLNEAISLAERVYAAYVSAGERRRAARVAISLVQDNHMKQAEAVAGAWIARAERLLENDHESAEYAALRVMRGLFASDLDTALSEARAAREIAERVGDRDVQALALMQEGAVLVAKGDVREGMGLIDEATIAAVAGELSLKATGVIYCGTISACRDIADFRRASEWTEAAIRWCERQAVRGFPGICRVHRAEILELRGALARAEQEARLAHDELTRFDLRLILGDSFYEIGSIRLRMGDLPAAEDAFRQAYEIGRMPEPGMSLIRVAQGNAAGANASLRRALADVHARPARARLLPAQVEVAIAAGDLATAREAAAELDEVAHSFGTSALLASAQHARGALAVAEGDPPAAEHALRSALELWQKLDAPYEAAQTRVLLARAARAAGDEERARLEFGAAKAIFERIGARRDARIIATDIGEQPEGAAPSETARVTRTFLFTDIVDSTKLIGVIGDEAWQDVIRWHDDALRAIIAEHGGEEIRHQGDGLVVSFDDPARALEAAIAIQRRLAEHRRTHGFAPAVRIGVHQTEATPRGLDYSGVGVHEAARVGALAGAGEIVVTRSTIDESKRTFTTTGARTVELKGIAEPVEVLSVSWR